MFFLCFYNTPQNQTSSILSGAFFITLVGPPALRRSEYRKCLVENVCDLDIAAELNELKKLWRIRPY